MILAATMVTTAALTKEFTVAAKAAAINNWQQQRHLHWQQKLQLSMTLAATMATISAVTEAFTSAAKAAAINDIYKDRGIHISIKSCSYR